MFPPGPPQRARARWWFPKEPSAKQPAAPTPSRHLRTPGHTSCFVAHQSVSHVETITGTATVARPPPLVATPRPTTGLRRCALALRLEPATEDSSASVTVGEMPRRARRTIRIGTQGTATHRGAGRRHPAPHAPPVDGRRKRNYIPPLSHDTISPHNHRSVGPGDRGHSKQTQRRGLAGTIAERAAPPGTTWPTGADRPSARAVRVEKTPGRKSKSQ